MHVTIEMGRHKADSRVFIDGQEVTRGILDFSVETGDIPHVVLKVWPEKLTVSGELGEVTKRDLLAYRREVSGPICICNRERQDVWPGGPPVFDRRLNPEENCPVHGHT